jgi:acyl carrier protein
MPAYPADFWQHDTELFGALPEFDSMTIVTLIGELEDAFDIVFDDEDINAENFETITSLMLLIDQRVS